MYYQTPKIQLGGKTYSGKEAEDMMKEWEELHGVKTPEEIKQENIDDMQVEDAIYNLALENHEKDIFPEDRESHDL